MSNDDLIEIPFKNTLKRLPGRFLILPTEWIFRCGFWIVPHVENEFPPDVQCPTYTLRGIREILEQVNQPNPKSGYFRLMLTALVCNRELILDQISEKLVVLF